ncbi:HD domain-containing phosphohydrolase [Amorphus orientalis]|uniref:GAF domain-containing protein n=1 Tax=Amorphus orientalis TaxID=649198 RepID=A0AAE3VP84_9HYPH|nr:HD domain-containing phosphohydrolase [Amorphus orientalis]MDQ0315265.1 GAF domain-containing protein [Amorphus orientalis]
MRVEPPLRKAIQGAAIFLVAAGAWVIMTDLLVAQFVTTSAGVAYAQSVKGIVFVLGCTAILFGLAHRHFSRLGAAGIELQNARDLLSISLESSGSTAFRFDIRKDRAEALPGFGSLIGEPDRPFSREDWLNRIDPEDRDWVETTLQSHLDRRSEQIELVYRVRHESGRLMWVMSRGRLLLDKNGAPDEIVGVHTEVSDREILREQVENANRALRALLRATRAIVFSRDKRSMFDAVCRDLAETGGFPLVWIGAADRDENKTVTVAASAGPYKDLPGQVSVSWSQDVPEGHGLVGEAIRSGQVQVSRTLAEDPRVAAWSKAINENELGSEIVIPIGGGEPTWGTLSVFSRTTEELSETDHEILANVGEDLWYAIRAMDREAEVQEAEAGRIALLERSAQRERELFEKTIDALARTIEKRDPFTAGHQRRVADLVEAIARRLDLPAERIGDMRLGALIHDIGKIAVPIDILTKPGKLTKEEYALVQTHARAGYEIIQGVGLSDDIVLSVLQHHERLDGSGYPSGLKGDDVGLPGRIVAVADAIEAMTSRRPYRDPASLEEALAELEKGRGERYDPDVLDACRAVLFEEGFDEVLKMDMNPLPKRDGGI